MSEKMTVFRGHKIYEPQSSSCALSYSKGETTNQGTNECTYAGYNIFSLSPLLFELKMKHF